MCMSIPAKRKKKKAGERSGLNLVILVHFGLNLTPSETKHKP